MGGSGKREEGRGKEANFILSSKRRRERHISPPYTPTHSLNFMDLAVLDAEDFDVLDYINEIFPDEASLSLLPKYTQDLNVFLEDVDQRIRVAIRESARSAQDATTNVAYAKQGILDLGLKISSIQTKANESQQLVEDICKEIRTLDTAKSNLTSSITNLKRVHMFLTAVDQLAAMSELRLYKEAGNLLRAVSELNEHFKGYQEPKVRELRDKVARTRDVLARAIFEDIEEIFSMKAIDVDQEDALEYYNQSPESLRGICVVADALGKEMKASMIKTLCNGFLQDYEELFPHQWPRWRAQHVRAPLLVLVQGTAQH